MTDSVDALRSRRINTEDLVRAQLAEVTRIRSDLMNPNRVECWSEAVEALADLLGPWANDESDGGVFLREWAARRVRHYRVPHPSGAVELSRLVAWPSARDCRESQLIVMRLMDRAGLLVKRRATSGPKPARKRETLPEGATGRDGGEPLLGAI